MRAPGPGSLRPGNTTEPDTARPNKILPGLYLVSTPIGNLEDITLRALRVLRSVDRIACEDTRVTRKLLERYEIHTPAVSYHQHNERSRAEELLAELSHGGSIAVVSDAGAPGISDPGAVLAEAAIAAGIPVIPIPGPNAAIAAVTASGLDAERFLFAGFLPSKAGERERELAALSLLPHTLVFYEAPHRLLDTLADMERMFGAGARIAVARELTKIHEEFLRGSIAEVRAQLVGRERILGEIVLIVQSDPESRPQSGPLNETTDIAARVKELMEREGLDRKSALKRAARERGLSRSQAYREVQKQQARNSKP